MQKSKILTNQPSELLHFELFVLAFFILHLLNAFALTSNLYCNNISWYHYTIPTFFSCLAGNFCVLLLCIATSLLIFKTYKSREIYIIISSFFLCLFIYAAMIYFNFYGMMFSLNNLSIFSNGDESGTGNFIFESLPLLLKGSNLCAFVPFVALIVLFLYLRKKKGNIEVLPLSYRTHAKRSIILFIIAIFGMIISMSNYDFSIKNDSLTDYDSLRGYQTMGVYNYYFYETYRLTFEKDSSELSNIEAKAALENYLSSETRYNYLGEEIERSSFENSFSGNNLLLIQVESLSDFTLGLSVNDNGVWKEVTPFLNSLMTDGTYFNQFYTSVGIGNTADAEFSVMTGLYSTGKNVSVYDYGNQPYDSLAKRFHENGYSTFSVHANTGKFYNRTYNHVNLYGFDEHLDSSSLATMSKEQTKIHGYLSDEDMLKTTVSYMKTLEETKHQPVFSFAITISNHIPYIMEDTMNEKVDKLFSTSSNLNSITENYLEHVHYTDYALSQCFEALEENELLDHTMVMLYGDHGCGIDAIDDLFLNQNIIKARDGVLDIPSDKIEAYLFRRQFGVQIPFIVYDATSILPKGVNSRVRGETDISETITSLYGLPSTYTFGVDAFSDESTFAYNPKNSDIFVDGVMISGQSLDVFYTNNHYFYTDEMIKTIVNQYKKIRREKEAFLKENVFL